MLINVLGTTYQIKKNQKTILLSQKFPKYPAKQPLEQSPSAWWHWLLFIQ